MSLNFYISKFPKSCVDTNTLAKLVSRGNVLELRLIKEVGYLDLIYRADGNWISIPSLLLTSIALLAKSVIPAIGIAIAVK